MLLLDNFSEIIPNMPLISMILNLDLRLYQKVAFMLNATLIKLKLFLHNVSKKIKFTTFPWVICLSINSYSCTIETWYWVDFWKISNNHNFKTVKLKKLCINTLVIRINTCFFKKKWNDIPMKMKKWSK